MIVKKINYITSFKFFKSLHEVPVVLTMYTLRARNAIIKRDVTSRPFKVDIDLEKFQAQYKFPRSGTIFELRDDRDNILFAGNSNPLLRCCLLSIAVAENVLS